MRSINLKFTKEHYLYRSPAESYRHILAMVIYTAMLDAANQIESSGFSRTPALNELTRRDAIDFFLDGRYKWHCERLDLDPDVLPAAWSQMARSINCPREINGETFGDWLQKRHEQQMGKCEIA